jgi:hypothetical protein
MQDWKNELDYNLKQFERRFGQLSETQLNKIPAPGTWSIAQNIQHLIIINESYYPIFQALINETYKRPLISYFGFVVKYMGLTILKSAQPDRKRKSKTFPIWNPQKSDIPGDILFQLMEHHEKLKEWIRKLSPYLDHRTIINSPANRNVPYRLITALDIIVAHERRHLVQASEVLKVFKK